MNEIVTKIREDFPALSREIYGKPLIYFDNAATSLKPNNVISMQSRLNSESSANVHRAVHKLSSESTIAYEEGREAVRRFINAQSTDQIIFTSGATAALNLVASSYGWGILKSGDTVIISEAEHHSNIVPWQFACSRSGAKIKVIPVLDNGELDIERYAQLLSEGVKLVAITHISNVLGVINPIKDIIDMAHSAGARVLIDGSQGVVHGKVDVTELDVDMYIFSGHKVYAPTGTGVLYGKRDILELMPPYMGGGDMVDSVSFEKTTYAPLPLKFEAGTPNFNGAACWSAAIDVATRFRDSEEVERHMESLTATLKDGLSQIPGLNVLGIDTMARIPLFSMYMDGVHTTDVAMLLDKLGIASRSGLLCAEPLVKRFSPTGLLRVSLLPYNSNEEVATFINALERVLAIVKG
jgi:cysteine desulfurase/selenocysteine lyase